MFIFFFGGGGPILPRRDLWHFGIPFSTASQGTYHRLAAAAQAPSKHSSEIRRTQTQDQGNPSCPPQSYPPQE